MKKTIFSLFLFLTVFASYAGDNPSFYNISDKHGIIQCKWSPFQFALVPEQYGQLVTAKADIYGLALGIFVMEQESAVLSVSLTSGQHKNNGLQCGGVTLSDLNNGLAVAGMIGFTERNYGAQISCVNVEAYGESRKDEHKSGFTGIQIGALNIGHSFQIGILNYNPDGWLPILPIINFSK